MLSATMLALTRTLALSVPRVAFKSTAIVGLQRNPLLNGLLSRRALSTTRYLLAPVVKKKPATRRVASKSTSSKSKTARAKKPKTTAKTKAKPKTKTKVKAKAKPKRKTKAKAKPTKPKVPAIVPRSERPPKRPPTPYLIFSSRAVTGSKTIAEFLEANKAGAAAWNNMSDAEKQPFKDEYKVLWRDYLTRRDKWFKEPKNTAILKRLNSRRAKYGKHRIHTPEGIKPKGPVPSFLRFYTELKSSGKLNLTDAPSDVRPTVWGAREAGARWKALPQAEKDKYTKAYRDDVARRRA